MKRTFIRLLSFIWFFLGLASFIVWIFQPVEETSNIRIINFPILSVLMIISGIGSFLIKRWGRKMVIFTSYLSISLSSFIWQAVHLRFSLDALPGIIGPIFMLIIFSLNIVKMEFEELAQPTLDKSSPE